MRKGLTTLMTVAIALVSVQAMALAPVIGDIPSPIVGNKAGGSQTTAYVYPDAFDLNTLVTDDQTAVASLKWSYEVVGTPKFVINGDAPINSGTEDPIAPAAAKTINTQMNGITGPPAANDPNPDGIVNTVTIRNTQLYPYGGSPSTDQSAAAQNWTNNMQAVTFWCSDGNLASSSTVMFYTDNTYNLNQPIGYNRITPSSKQWKLENFDPLNGTKPAWALADPLSGNISTHSLSGNAGICFEVGKTGDNWASVMSPMPFFALTDNQVYRIRATMNGSQSTGGKTPFWDFIVTNWNGNVEEGLNLYGMDSFYMDNELSANAILSSTPGTEVTMYFVPPAFQTTTWRSTTTGAFQSELDAQNDAQLRFRVLDVETNQGSLRNDLKQGAICLQSVIVESIPFSKMTIANPTTGAPVNITAPKAAYNPVPPATTSDGNMQAAGLTGTAVAYTGGILKLTPQGNATGNEMVQVAPAVDLQYHSPGNDILDDWPIKWTAKTLYELEVSLSTPTANDAAHPYDVFWMSMEPPTYEVATETFVTSNKGIASPKQTAQTYYMFYYSMNETNSTAVNFHQLRWRLRFGNSANLNWPQQSDTTNTGAVQVRSIKVNVVTFPVK